MNSKTPTPSVLLFQQVLSSAEEMQAAGRTLGGHLLPKDVVFLRGDMGAGKTTFAAGAIEALLGTGAGATSPTFTLVHVWETARGPLWHLDLWRLKSPEEVFEIGLDEALSCAMTLIEWPERLGPYAPVPTLEVIIDILEEGRHITILGQADRAWGEIDDARSR